MVAGKNSLSIGVLALLFFPKADGALNRADEHFAVADLPSSSRLDDDVHGVVHDENPDLGERIDGVFAAAVSFRMAFLASEAFHFADRLALDAEARQRFFDLFKLERINDGLGFFHSVSSRSVTTDEDV